jgi:hypothetical protein
VLGVWVPVAFSISPENIFTRRAARFAPDCAAAQSTRIHSEREKRIRLLARE